ncbi:MAG: peptidoglycan DD-metalloendopeptidase family protein [Gammaproteobacteria bacterium]
MVDRGRRGAKAPLLQLQRIATLMLLVVFCSEAWAQSGDTAQRAAELEQLRERIQSLRSTLDADLGRRDTARAALRDSEQTIARHAAILRDIEHRLAESRAKLQSIAADRALRERELDREQVALAGQIRAAHALGRQERLKLMLNQQDPAAVGRTLVYYDYLNRSRVARIDRVAGLLEEISALEASAEAEQATLAAAQDAERRALEAFARTRDERAAVIAAIERAVRDRGQRLQRLEADEQALLKLLESLSNLLADVPDELGTGGGFAALRGGLGWPARGGMLTRFGERRDGAPRSRGLLIGASAGSDVRAIAYGRVAWAGWMPHYGNLLVLDHGNDYYTLYGHNQTLLREVGEWVRAGDVIAQVGDSGGQPQPALYFELRKGRTPLNPQQWLARAN